MNLNQASRRTPGPGTPSPGRAAPSRPGRTSGVIVAAAPAIVFVAADAVSSLHPALAAAGGAAVAGFAWRLVRHQPAWQALAGLGVSAACAGVAALTGQERGFFLIPALVPFAVIAVCVTSVVAGRPLTGVLLNRVAGGPPGWRQVPGLRRVYVVSTLVCTAVSVVNAAVQAVFYLADDPVALAVAHVATGPVFAAIVAVTIAFARRAMRGSGARAPARHARPGVGTRGGHGCSI
jgi:Protein of unknown function (DUF3159)